MTDLELALYQRVHIRLQHLPTSHNSVVCARLGHFLVAPGHHPADVLCAPMPEGAAVLRHLAPKVAPQQVTTVWFEGRRVLFYSHRGDPDLILDPGTPIRLFVARRAGVVKRFYNALLFAIHLSATRHGGLLLHAAALRDPAGRTALVLGPRRSRKTHLTLQLLHQGWDYLADDKLLLLDRRAHLFERRLIIRRHHLGALPWLATRLDHPSAPLMVRSHRLRRLLERLQHQAARHIDEKLQPRLQPLLDPAATCDLSQVFPDNRILSSARPDALFILAPGVDLDCVPLAPATQLSQLVAIEQLYLAGMGPLDAMSRYAAPETAPPELSTLLAENLGEIPGFMLSLPEQAPASRLGAYLAAQLAATRPGATPCPD
ncbi:hypothetical protein [Marichromatium bheemlicum]|uniref:Hpr(Ser) kinase/phosphatase n=1 Tax=Marichromatium bheemlicum TaxID=365339 RepID=A0ABX1ICJ2_9GAMM|nr:hypothetical protein [Marichromatium bheemlicum]NKN33900.1 hypothetical protein [Marichromatium bheemlicum]